MSKGKNTTDQTNLRYIGPYFSDGFVVGNRTWNPDRMSATEIEEFQTLIPEAKDWWVKYEMKDEKKEK